MGAIQKISIFGETEEKWNLRLPVMFGFGIIALLIAGHGLTGEEKNILITTRGTVFFGQIHVFMTFSLMLFSPKVKQWVQGQNIVFHFSWISIFVVSFLFTWLGSQFFSQLYGGEKVYRFLLALFTCAAMHHSYAQTMGLSFLYNRMLEERISFEEKKKVLRLERIEKAILNIMITAQSLNLTMRMMKISHFYLNRGTIVFCTLCALCLIAISTQYPRASESNRTYFVLRYLFYPFVYVSIACGSARAALHGIEYLFVFRKMTSRKEMKISNGAVIRAWALTAVLTILIFGNQNMFGWILSSGNTALNNFTIWTTSLMAGAANLHYHFDGVLYKMKKTQNRELIGPLLIDSHKIEHAA